LTPDDPERRPELSVVAPLYRTAESLAELVDRIRRSLEGIRWELILVDDASPDGAAQLATKIAEEEPRVGVLALARNGGQSEALRAGALLTRGRKVAFIDADLQDPPEILPRLLAAGGEAELVFGIRGGAYQSLSRRLSSRIFKALRSRLCRVPAGAGLLLLADGELLRRAARAAPYPCRWIPLLGSLKPKMAAIPIERAERPRGSSAYVGLMRLEIGLFELAAALRLRCGLRPGAPRLAEPEASLVRLPGA
jgi:hypothetical protein